MSAVDRAREDEERGDLGSARKRLTSYAAAHFKPEDCERVARLSMRMKDPVEAGRWYFLCDSADAESPDAVRCFLQSCGNQPRHVLSALPRGIRSRNDWPAGAAGRLRDIGFQPALPLPDAIPPTRFGKVVDWAIVAIGLSLFACTIIGVATAVRWIVGLF